MNTIPRWWFLLLLGSCLQAAPPSAIASKVQEVRTLFAEATHPAYRVHLMVLPNNKFVDPAPRAEHFEGVAQVVLTIESGAGIKLIEEAMDEVEKSSWKAVSPAGYPGSYWQLRGPSGVIIDFLVDEVGGLVGHAGVWYVVDRRLLTVLTTDTIRVGTGLLAKRRTPEWKP